LGSSVHYAGDSATIERLDGAEPKSEELHHFPSIADGAIRHHPNTAQREAGQRNTGSDSDRYVIQEVSAALVRRERDEQ